MNQKKTDKILHEIYRRIYKASTPSADWDELVANATTNELGQKVIPYDDYECSDEMMRKIIYEVLKENKVPKWRRSSFEASIWLGCSPKSKRI